MLIEVTRAPPDRLPTLGSIIGRAFVNEPMILWWLGEEPDVGQRCDQWFQWLYEPLVGVEPLWEAGDAKGTAAWIPSDAGEPYHHAFDTSRPLAHTLTADGGRRYDVFWEWVESKLPDEPAWHLDAIAVESDVRGLGFGTALVETGLDLARADDVGAFLEVGLPPNVPYYERFGFRVYDEADAPDGGPHVWFMRGDP